MRRYALAGVAATIALCGCGRGGASQQTTNATTPPPEAGMPMTIVGCLVQDTATREPTDDGRSTAPPPPAFALVNATVPARESAAPGVAGTSGAASPSVQGAMQPATFRLVADKDRLDDLQRFANARVEVTGSIVASTGNGAPDVGAASAPAGAPPSDVRRLQVKDVRRLEPTCGASKKE